MGCRKTANHSDAVEDAIGTLGDKLKDGEESTDEYKEDPIITFKESGYFYTEGLELEIVSSRLSDIYFTMDGSDPSKDKTLYKEAIELKADQTTKAICIKAKAFCEDGTESETIVHTYFVGKDIVNRFDTLVFSVTTDPYNLFDYEYGIFVEGKLRDEHIKENPQDEIQPNDPANFNMRGREAEREVYLEVFEPDGTRIIDQPAGIRTYGGWSRAREQKSIKIFARKEYSEKNNKFRYEFFPYKTSADDKGNVLGTFKQLVLRNCGNDNGFGFIRDELFQTLAALAGYADYEAVRPAALYLNGDYRGFFWLHEVYCDEYFEDHYGDYNGNFEILEGGDNYKIEDEDGENSEFVADYEDMYSYAWKDLTDDSIYNELCELVDVENYLEYFALQSYINNEDWPHNNYKTYRYYAAKGDDYKKAPFDGKWRYLLHDLDFSFGIYGTSAMTYNIATYVGKNGELKEASPLFSQLMKRADCKEIFIKKTLDLINGAFAPDNIITVLDKMNVERLNELSNTYDKNLLEEWVTYDQLEGKLSDIKNYGITRATYIINKYKEHFMLGDLYQLNVMPAEGCEIKINSFVTSNKFEGSYYTDYNTVVTPIMKKGRKFDYWLVNGEEVEAQDLVITSANILEGKVEVTCVAKK
jgi:hypothetical protein